MGRAKGDAQKISVVRRLNTKTLSVAETAEIKTCLELAEDSLPDYNVSEYADRFDALIKAASQDKLALSPSLASAITELISVGLQANIDPSQRHRLQQAIQLMLLH